MCRHALTATQWELEEIQLLLGQLIGRGALWGAPGE